MPASKTRRNARRHKGPTPPRGGRRSNQTLPPVYAELLNAMEAAEVSVLAQFLGPGTNRSAPPSRRRPRREEAVTYRARVEIAYSDPLIWRRIELTSDLTLDSVHDLLQAVMGWSDDHLHQFGSGEDLYDPDTERYLMPFSISEGAVGIDEGTVHLDEVLVEPGDRLWYEYDFGDSWAHIIELEEVLDPDPGAPSARCLAGGGACPPEDCGGIWGYANLLEVLAGPPGPERHELYEWVGSDFDPASFDPDRVNAALAGPRLSVASCLPPGIDPHSPLGALIEGMGGEVPTRIAAALDALVLFRRRCPRRTGHAPSGRTRSCSIESVTTASL